MRHTLSDLKQDPRNARRHSDRNIETIASSIRDNGFGRPIFTANEGTIIGGNATAIAAAQAGLDNVLVIESDGTQVIAIKRTDVAPGSPEFHRLAFTDNFAADLAEWDPAILEELAGEVDLSAYINDDELEALIAGITGPTEGLTDPDDVPAPPKEPITKPGDLWQLGRHRLLCGDATVVTDVERLMGGEKAVLMATDPPYLVDYQGGNHPQSWSNQKSDKRDKHWDDYNEQQGVQFYTDFISIALTSALVKNPAIYQWFAIMRADMVMAAWKANALLQHQILIWVKARAVLTHSDYMWKHEACMYGWVQGNRPDFKPPANMTTVWEIDKQGESDGIHPTQKPVELVRRAIEYHTKLNDLIYEPFSGSGTAIIAADELGRRCFAMELSPEFVDVAVTRWQNFTGQTATLVTDIAQAAD